MILEKTQVLCVSPTLSESGDIEKLEFAADVLKKGGLVAFPTETVYGLGANALDENAVASIFKAKGRPQDNPLIVHVESAERINEYAYAEGNRFFEVLKDEMPAPLTVVLPKRDIVPSVTSGGLSSVGMRVPLSKVARKLIELSGLPVAAPSANLSGKPSPTRAQHVIDDMYGRADVIIDAGACRVGLESTVVSLTGDIPEILRPGGFTKEMLERLLGNVKVSDAVLEALKEGQKASSPGMKYKHYAPEKKVVLLNGSAQSVRKHIETLLPDKSNIIICYDEDCDERSGRIILMGSRNNSEEYAERLFDALRTTDAIDGGVCVYASLPEKTAGISLAIYNRMLRAASFNVVDTEKGGEADKKC